MYNRSATTQYIYQELKTRIKLGKIALRQLRRKCEGGDVSWSSGVAPNLAQLGVSPEAHVTYHQTQGWAVHPR